MSTTISGTALNVATITSPTLTSPTLTTPTINSASVPTVSGTAPLYMCRAWVNFNGTGTVAIRASGNVSSITDNGVGDYTVNFTTAMPDANYNSTIGYVSTALVPSGSTSSPTVDISSYSTSGVSLRAYTYLGTTNDSTYADFSTVCVSVFR